MVSISLSTSTTEYIPNLSAYKLHIAVSSYQNISPYVFVKQRYRLPDKKNFGERFAAIASPTQLQDLGVGCPHKGTSYFLSDCVDLVDTSAEVLGYIFQQIENDVQKLVSDLVALDNFSSSVIYTFSAS